LGADAGAEEGCEEQGREADEHGFMLFDDGCWAGKLGQTFKKNLSDEASGIPRFKIKRLSIAIGFLLQHYAFGQFVASISCPSGNKPTINYSFLHPFRHPHIHEDLYT
jgi:hypothetical protein